MKSSFHIISMLLAFWTLTVQATAPRLIVVEDRGGTSALPYYQALDLPISRASLSTDSTPAHPGKHYREADMLPVRSPLLSPGEVPGHIIQATGLSPLFVIGDDARSRTWLKARLNTLRNLNATGLVVQVETSAALTALRALAPGLTLSPVSGDDLALRLGLRHYPALITSTSVEQ